LLNIKNSIKKGTEKIFGYQKAVTAKKLWMINKMDEENEKGTHLRRGRRNIRKSIMNVERRRGKGAIVNS